MKKTNKRVYVVKQTWRACDICGKQRPNVVRLSDKLFYCGRCIDRAPKHAVLDEE